jgi:hypothetical protein
VLIAVVAVWLWSTDQQRRGLLVQFGLAESMEQAELTELALIGPGFRLVLIPALPPPDRDVVTAPDATAPRPRAPTTETLRPAPHSLDPAPAVGDRIAHGDDPCAVGAARNPSRSGAARPVHRFVDENGRVTFSDRAPVGATSQRLNPRGDLGVSRFSADYEMVGFQPPTGFQHQLEIDLDGVFHFLADDLGLRDVQPVHLRLRIIDGRGRFAGLASDTRLQNVNGFYRHRENLAAVRWMGEERTRAVARHEIAHLALGNWLGRTPLWLNEGLAEVVETMRFQQSFALADAPARRLEQLRRQERAGRLPRLMTPADLTPVREHIASRIIGQQTAFASSTACWSAC